jgi:phospholipase C
MAPRRTVVGLLGLLCVSAATAVASAGASAGGRAGAAASGDLRTATPIKHVVVIFQENISFDHYFGTYPNAANTDGQTFAAAPGTPAINGLPPATADSLPPALRHASNLLATNPNSALPQRLDSSATGLAGSPGGQLTCDQNHEYPSEQQAFNRGRMDQFVQSVGTGSGTSPSGAPCNANTVMNYYDGNTVTALWNYAQHFAMSDNSYGTTFGPSTPGAINLVAGTTGHVDTSHQANNPPISSVSSPDGDITADGKGGFSLTSDAQPYWDDCSYRDAVGMSGQNIGDVLNHAGLSWGWFQGGNHPTTNYRDALGAIGKTGQSTSTFIPNQFIAAGFNKKIPHSSNYGLCNAVHPVGVRLGGNGQYGYKNDYIPHHEPFNYYASTANPHHLTITTAHGVDTLAGLRQIGRDTQSYKDGVPQFNTPNHQYDITDFNQLVAAITKGRLPASALPAVSFVKAPGYQDGHAAYSDPRDEQLFVVREINALMRSPDWSSTAVVIAYDDSDGWYDHAYSGVTNPSISPADNLSDTVLNSPLTSGLCGPRHQTRAPLDGEQGRCGFGPRLPLLVISPFARHNRVDHNLSNQASIINFVEYNWGLPSIDGSADHDLTARNRAAGLPFDLAGLFKFDGSPNGGGVLNPETGVPVRR